MPRISQHPKETSFNLRLDSTPKPPSPAAPEAEAQVLRDFMRAYIRQRERRAFEAKAGRQSTVIAQAALDPSSDEASVMRELDRELADESGWSEGAK